MTPRIEKLLALLRSGEYKALRDPALLDNTPPAEITGVFLADAYRLKALLDAQTPILLPEEPIGFFRSRSAADPRPYVGNVTPDYPRFLHTGMDAMRADIAARLDACTDDRQDFYRAELICFDAVLALADRWRAAAEAQGCTELADSLCRVPHGPAVTFADACVFLKLLIFVLRCNHNSHIGLGRFDQYMLPFYRTDVRRGVPAEALFETLEAFFVNINFDIDLYQGIQAGDNGQSMMLGGYTADGTDCYNELSEACMNASLELNLIDPKINLRVGKNTPIGRLEFATRLTRQGLGFPQYCNDDIVIPALTALGYAPQDAENYTVAACWEYIIPGKGMDWPNIATMNFPKVIEKVTREQLEGCADFDVFVQKVREGIAAECGALMQQYAQAHHEPSVFLSAVLEGCTERGLDISQWGAVYNNFGCHGAGIATAADALAAIREVVFEKKECTAQQLLAALEADFEGYGPLRNRLLGCPKMGNDDPAADALGDVLMDAFSASLNGKPNGLGGIWRAGTGSAMEYILSAAQVGATADGRRAGSPYGSSFSPSPECRLNGPLSCIKSFTRFAMQRICNGGPLTMEVHSSTFRNEEGIKKVARLVQAFILRGGHQLQLNAVNRDVLLAALEHPEQYKNLIVRVWGWSGYFTELDPPYQQHILHRTEFMA